MGELRFELRSPAPKAGSIPGWPIPPKVSYSGTLDKGPHTKKIIDADFPYKYMQNFRALVVQFLANIYIASYTRICY